MNIPNLLTLLRIILSPVIVILLIQGSFFKALIVFIVAGITDALDGFLARVLHQQTVLGAYLDPIADKALLASSFVTLSVLHIIPGWLDGDRHQPGLHHPARYLRAFHHVDSRENPADFRQQGHDGPAADYGSVGTFHPVSSRQCQ